MPNTSKTLHYKVDNYNPNTKNKEELDPIVKFVNDCWDKWDSYWGNRFNKFEEYYKRWKDKPPKRNEDWQSQFQKRLTWQSVATLVSRYYSILFPVSAPIEAEATETQDEVYRILAKSIVSHWFKLGKVNKEFLSSMRSSSIYGTGLFEDDWYVKTASIVERVNKRIPDFRSMVDGVGNKIFDEEGNIRSEQIGFKNVLIDENKKKLVEDRYRVKKTSIFAWRIHPYKKDDDDDYPVIKQEFVSFEDLKEMETSAQQLGFSKFENLDKIENDSFKIDSKDTQRIGYDTDFNDDKNPRIELKHYWGLYSEKEKVEKKPTWICVANKKYKLWLRDNPFWHKKSPLTHINWTDDEKGGYYGIGLAEIGGDAEDRANTVVNIRIDERKKNVRGGGTYNALDKKIRKTDLQKNIPGAWIGTSDINNIKPSLPIPKSTLDDYKEEETAVNDHREITGATTSLLPTADIKQQHSTLGGMELLMGQGLQRLKSDLSMIEIMGIRRLANRAFLLTRQFMSLPQTIELVASEDKLKQFNLSRIYKMEPLQLMGGVNFFCTGLSESIDKIQNIEKALKFMEVLQKTSPGNPFIQYLTKKIALWLGFEDAEQFLSNIPMIQQPQQAMPGLPMQGQGQGQPPMPNQPMPIPIPMQQPQGGLPPQLLQLIVQSMMRGQMQNQMNQPNQAGVI